jgi:hypothetical protein
MSTRVDEGAHTWIDARVMIRRGRSGCADACVTTVNSRRVVRQSTSSRW